MSTKKLTILDPNSASKRDIQQIRRSRRLSGLADDATRSSAPTQSKQAVKDRSTEDHLRDMLADKYGNAVYMSREGHPLQVNILTTATQIVAPAAYAQCWRLKNVMQLLAGTDNIIYISNNDGVSSVSGYGLLEHEEVIVIIGEGVGLWGIAKTSTLDLRIMRA